VLVWETGGAEPLKVGETLIGILAKPVETPAKKV
jgi:hypothetical protein